MRLCFNPLLQTFPADACSLYLRRSIEYTAACSVRQRLDGGRISRLGQRSGAVGVAVCHAHRLDFSVSSTCLPHDAAVSAQENDRLVLPNDFVSQRA